MKPGLPLLKSHRVDREEEAGMRVRRDQRSIATPADAGIAGDLGQLDALIGTPQLLGSGRRDAGDSGG